MDNFDEGGGFQVDVLTKLEEKAKRKTKDLSQEETVIRGLFSFDLLFKPSPKERTFSYTVITAECLAQGSCYTYEDVDLDKELMGKDAREVEPKYRSVKIAILDALYGGIERNISQTYYLRGSAKEKAVPRAEIVCHEVARLFDSLKGKKVVNVGVVGEFLPCLLLRQRGVEVFLTDMDPNLLGGTIHGMEVEGPDKTLPRVKESDVAIVTGMTLATNTLGEIIEASRENNTKIVMFAETGANFGEALCHLGVDTVVGEPFPFYIFHGESRIDVYRKIKLEDVRGNV